MNVAHEKLPSRRCLEVGGLILHGQHLDFYGLLRNHSNFNHSFSFEGTYPRRLSRCIPKFGFQICSTQKSVTAPCWACVWTEKKRKLLAHDIKKDDVIFLIVMIQFNNPLSTFPSGTHDMSCEIHQPRGTSTKWPSLQLLFFSGTWKRTVHINRGLSSPASHLARGRLRERDRKRPNV